MRNRYFSDGFSVSKKQQCAATDMTGGLNGRLGRMTRAGLWHKTPPQDHWAPRDEAGERKKKEKQINVASPPPLLVQTLHHLSCCLLLTSARTGPAAVTPHGCQVRRNGSRACGRSFGGRIGRHTYLFFSLYLVSGTKKAPAALAIDAGLNTRQLLLSFPANVD